MLTFHLDPTVDGGLAVLLGLYFALRRSTAAAGWSGPVCFGSGLLIVWIALESPLDSLGDGYLQSAHMVQHMLLMAVAPPLLLLGLAPAMAARLGRLPGMAAITAPVPALCAAGVAVVAWHLPGPYDAALRSDPLHIAQHLSFLAGGTLFWWSIVDATSTATRWRPSQAQKLAYLLAGSFPMMGVALVLQFSHQPFYPFYAHAPRVLPEIGPLTDQIISGTLMMTIDVGASGIAGLIIAYRWLNGSIRADAERQRRLQA